MNRNKRSVVLDLKTAGGRADLHRLVQEADVLVENFRPGVAERLGASYAELSRIIGAAGLPAGALRDYGQVLADPHTLATGMVVEDEHPHAGTIRILGSPLHFGESSFTVEKPPPLLGQRTDEVLGATRPDIADRDPLRGACSAAADQCDRRRPQLNR